MFVWKNNVKIIRFVSCSRGATSWRSVSFKMTEIYGSSIQQGKGRDIIVLYLLYIWCKWGGRTRIVAHSCLRLAVLFLIADHWLMQVKIPPMRPQYIAWVGKYWKYLLPNKRVIIPHNLLLGGQNEVSCFSWEGRDY